MDKINLAENIDFLKMNTAANKRDIQLWKQQATAKYCKQKYEEFRRENEVLDSKIEYLEHKISKNEKKIVAVKALSERMVESVIIASNTTDHLIQLKLCVKSEIASLEKEYGTLIENYSNMYKQQRMALEKNNSLYRKLSEITTKVDKMRIQKNQLSQNNIDKQKMIKQKCIINNKILVTNIVEFAEAITSARKLESINKTLAEKQAEAENLLVLYEKQNDVKRNIQKYGYIERNELPKLSIQMKPMSKPVELKVPQLTSPAKTVQNILKLVTVPKVNEMSLLQKLKERSSERLKTMCHGQNSSILPVTAREQERKHVENNSSTAGAIDENEIENKLDTLQQINPKSPCKINVLQNEVICSNNAIESRAKESQKRHSSEMVKSIIKKKKNKRVSFGEYISQDDPTNIFANSENIANTTAKSSQDIQEISSYVSTNSNVESYQQGARSNAPVVENPTSPQFCFQGDESFYMAKDPNETCDDRIVFSPTDTAENIFEQTANNNTFLSWNQPNSQQNTSFGSIFNIKF